MKLVGATLFLGEARMTVYIETDNKIRRLKVVWMAAGDEQFLPPMTWADSARGEAELRVAEEKNLGLPGILR